MRIGGLSVPLTYTFACNAIVEVPDGVVPEDCSPAAEFTSRHVVPGLEGIAIQNAQLTSDETTVVVTRITYEGPANAPIPRYGDIFVAHRDSRDTPFADLMPLTELNSLADEFTGALADDRLSVMFDRQDEFGMYQIFRASRSSVDEAFARPMPVTLGDDSSDFQPYLVPAGLFFSSSRTDNVSSLFHARALDSNETPTWLMSLETLPFPTAYETPAATADGTNLFFSAPKDPTVRTRDIWLATRASLDVTFDAPRAVTSLNSEHEERPAWISDDNCRLYYIADHSGTPELWMAFRREL